MSFELYNKYFTQKDDERRELFKILQDVYKPTKGLYPGSFVHITPSLYIPDMTYVDTDKRCMKFFDDPEVIEFLKKHKNYPVEPSIKFYKQNFTKEIPEKFESFDIIISLYAGFISKHCKKHLRLNGLLVANNSHGDASISFTDNDFSLEGVFKRRGKKFRLSHANLEEYFLKKDGSPIDKDKVLKQMRGEGFTKTGYAYLFRKIR